MLKFILVAFLFLGLAVNGKEQEQSEEQSEEHNVMNFNQHVQDSDERAVNEKTESTKEEHQVSSEESSEEDQYDNAAAAEKVVSEDNNEEFDQNDDVGSKAMLEENQEQDDTSAWCGLSKCRGFVRMRAAFYRYRRYCIRCLRSRRCRSRCNRFLNYRRRGYRACMYRVGGIFRYWRVRLRRNYRKFAKAHNLMRKYYQYANYWNRRAKGKTVAFSTQWKNTYLARTKLWVSRYKSRRKKYLYYLKMRNKWYRRYRRNRRNRGVRRRYLIFRSYASRWRSRMLYALRKARANWRAYQIMVLWIKWRKLAIKYWKMGNAQKAKRARLLRRRRRLYYLRNRAVRKHRIRCGKRYNAYRWACIYCNGRCGNVCWAMHVYYGNMVLQAHRCKMQRYLCRKKSVYKKYFLYFNRLCARCRRVAKPRVRTLVCSSRCGSKRKFYQLWRYYKSKC